MTVFVTFRTADALPRHVVDRYLVERRIVDRLLERDPENDELHRERARRFGHHIDYALDGGLGRCPLRDPTLAQKVHDTLLRRDGIDYVLHASVVMPNHVHLVATLGPETALQKVTQAWKSVTAHAATRDFGQSAPFWQEESYDHIARHERALRAVVRYVVENPKKAGLGWWPWIYQWEEGESEKAAGEAPAPQ